MNAQDAILEKISPDDLDEQNPEQYREMFPAVGSSFVLIATR